MPAEKKKSALAAPKKVMNTRKSPDFRSIYANNAVFEVSVFDVRITFGEASKADGESMDVEQRVSVVMSPQHAKVFAQILMSNIEGYERQIATIPLPSSQDS